MKTCRKCEQALPSQDFYANKRNKDGLTSYCKSCSKSASTGWWRDKASSEAKAKRDRRKRLRKYGLKISDFERMAAEQGNACKICRAQASLCVDHCHSTGRVRGLLCNNCNLALGLVGDNCATLASAINYLENH